METSVLDLPEDETAIEPDSDYGVAKCMKCGYSFNFYITVQEKDPMQELIDHERGIKLLSHYNNHMIGYDPYICPHCGRRISTIFWEDWT